MYFPASAKLSEMAVSSSLPPIESRCAISSHSFRSACSSSLLTSSLLTSILRTCSYSSTSPLMHLSPHSPHLSSYFQFYLPASARITGFEATLSDSQLSSRIERVPEDYLPHESLAAEDGQSPPPPFPSPCFSSCFKKIHLFKTCFPLASSPLLNHSHVDKAIVLSHLGSPQCERGAHYQSLIRLSACCETRGASFLHGNVCLRRRGTWCRSGEEN